MLATNQLQPWLEDTQTSTSKCIFEIAFRDDVGGDAGTDEAPEIGLETRVAAIDELNQLFPVVGFKRPRAAAEVRLQGRPSVHAVAAWCSEHAPSPPREQPKLAAAQGHQSPCR